MDHKDLDVWKEAMSLVGLVYMFAGQFPEYEQYGLNSQIKRAAVHTRKYRRRSRQTIRQRDDSFFIYLSWIAGRNGNIDPVVSATLSGNYNGNEFNGETTYSKEINPWTDQIPEVKMRKEDMRNIVSKTSVEGIIPSHLSPLTSHFSLLTNHQSCLTP